jgi:hypothetical protein
MSEDAMPAPVQAYFRQGIPDEVRAYFRACTARRRQVEHTCAVCGKAFRSIPWARYCSPACSQRAYRQRKRSQPAGS